MKKWKWWKKKRKTKEQKMTSDEKKWWMNENEKKNIIGTRDLSEADFSGSNWHWQQSSVRERPEDWASFVSSTSVKISKVFYRRYLYHFPIAARSTWKEVAMVRNNNFKFLCGKIGTGVD